MSSQLFSHHLLLPALLVGSWCAATAVAPADDFPTPTNSEKQNLESRMPAEEAAAKMQLPKGFRATVFAAEPNVQNPIGMSWDAGGRLWIAENYTYAERKQRFDLSLRDRVLVFEDADGDGVAESRKVFVDDVQMLTSVAVGAGGVWLMCPPRLLFIPDADHDAVPDGPVQVKLDGFDVAQGNYHNFANGLKFGPDGWLYGRCGHSCPGKIGKPGTPDARRLVLAGGMWRFDPQTGAAEVLNYGTTNPWGHDWNEHGQPFLVNTVTGHLWHAITGGRFTRSSSIDPNRYVYEVIDQHADHYHYDRGKSWTASRDGKANSLGGGHAHSGTMIYLGDNWPSEYRGSLFTLNLHGRRANRELIVPRGSGYVAKHAADFFISADPWFRGIDLDYGPDGGVFVLDWSDTGECHESTGVHRQSGRIFKITYGTPKTELAGERFVSLWKRSDTELVKLHQHRNEWFTRQARITLAERTLKDPKRRATVAAELTKLVRAQNVRVSLRAFHTLQAIGTTDDAVVDGLAEELMDHADPYLRAAAVRCWVGKIGPLDGVNGPRAEAKSETNHGSLDISKLTQLAEKDPAGIVRLTLAESLRRLPTRLRPELAVALVRRAADANDHNLPLLVWYGLFPVAESQPKALVEVAVQCRWPKTQRFIARRLAEAILAEPAAFDLLLTAAMKLPAAEQANILSGITTGLQGWRKVKQPKHWSAFVTAVENNTDDAAVSQRLRELSVLFGDGRALASVRKLALDRRAPASVRLAALESLLANEPDDLADICKVLLRDRHLRLPAARGLVRENDPAIGRLLIDAYDSFRPRNRSELISLLTTRATFARELLVAIEKGKLPRSAINAYQARQINGLGDAKLQAELVRVWGKLTDTPEAQARRIAELRKQLAEYAPTATELSEGRRVYQATCAKCHTLYGEGGKIGPDLTGSNRNNLDYLLENIVTPSAVISKDFRLSSLQMADGRVLSGVILKRGGPTVTLQTQDAAIVLRADEVRAEKITNLSPMPAGLLDKLTDAEIRGLFAYLRHSRQVPLARANEGGGKLD